MKKIIEWIEDNHRSIVGYPLFLVTATNNTAGWIVTFAAWIFYCFVAELVKKDETIKTLINQINELEKKMMEDAKCKQ